ncbi:MAG: type VI secretion system baseplate subunit TssK [Pseudomonadota bacterium]
MSETGRVVWYEGMFLRTQHFQQHDRFIDGLVRDVLDSQSRPVIGFRRLVLDENALSAGMIGILEADGIFPDGTPFSIPGGSHPLDPTPVPQGAEVGDAVLALKADSAGRPSIDRAHSDPSDARLRGMAEEVRDATYDRGQSGPDPEEIEVARLAPRIFPPRADTDGYVTLPLARLVGREADGALRRDPDYLAPAMMTSAVPWYGRFAQEMVDGLDRVIELHAGVVLKGTGDRLDSLQILELANSARPRMAHFQRQDRFHPSEFYLELASLAGRMATYAAPGRRIPELPDYAHLDPQPAFAALAEVLRAFLLTLQFVQQKSRELPVAKHDAPNQHIWKVRIDNPEILKTDRIVLRVSGERARLSNQVLRQLFVDQATVGSDRNFEALWLRKKKGIELKPLHIQPEGIPFDGDRLCLELDRGSDGWETLMTGKGIVIGVAVTKPLERDPDIDCFAIKR